jgi:ubiquinone/menaquinone biosynthesis C-methylase UbiE
LLCSGQGGVAEKHRVSSFAGVFKEDRIVGDEAEARKVQMRAIFDRLAPEYDAAGPGCFAYFGLRLVEEVGIPAGERVLDVASGRGAVLFAAAEKVGPTGTAVGIDLAE